jgi:hypothetical protein
VYASGKGDETNIERRGDGSNQGCNYRDRSGRRIGDGWRRMETGDQKTSTTLINRHIYVYEQNNLISCRIIARIVLNVIFSFCTITFI